MYFRAPFELMNIKKQFRELSKKLHPDTGGNDVEFNLMKYEHDVILKVISERPVRRIVLKRVPPKKVTYHFTADENAMELIKSLKKIFK